MMPSLTTPKAGLGTSELLASHILRFSLYGDCHFPGFAFSQTEALLRAGPFTLKPDCPILNKALNKDIQQVNIYSAPILLKTLLGTARETEIKKIVSACKEFTS